MTPASPLAVFLDRIAPLTGTDLHDAVCTEVRETGGAFWPHAPSTLHLHGIGIDGASPDDAIARWTALARHREAIDAALAAAIRALYAVETPLDALTEACATILRHSTERSLRDTAQAELDRLSRAKTARQSA